MPITRSSQSMSQRFRWWRMWLALRFVLAFAILWGGQILTERSAWAADETVQDAIAEDAPEAADMTPRIAPGVSPEVSYLHYDAGGNVVATTDSTGGVTWRAQMQPFGLGETSSPAGAEDRPLNFVGQPIEAVAGESSGLYHLGARYYDPMIGRFMGVDPLAVTDIARDDPARFNRFAYGLNNPYRYVDATGATPDDARKFLLELAKQLPETVSDPAIKGSSTPVRELTERLAKLPQSKDALVKEGAAVAQVTKNGFANWLRNAWAQGAIKTIKQSAPRSNTNFKLPGIIGLGVGLVLAAPSIAEAAETSSEGRYGSTIGVGYEYLRGSIALVNPMEWEIWANKLNYTVAESLYGLLGFEEYLPARQKTAWELQNENVQKALQDLDAWLAEE